MSFIEERKALTREKRLSTLSHYDGTLESLSDEVQGAEIKQRLRTFTQSTYDEILYAIQALSGIEDIAIIVHGSVGCAASGVYYNQLRNIQWYSTNLNERDTILGGDEKLRRAVLRAQEETNAKAIFIVGTPVVAINNDDVNSVILELEDELGVKLISVSTDGFKTKAPVSGYDMVLHSLLRYVVDRGAKDNGEKEDFINVVSISENRENVAAILQILRDLGISYQLLPQFAGIEQIERAGKARATITLNSDQGGYFAQELEEVFGVPYIKTSVPIGLRGTRHWITKLAKELGIEEKAKKYVEQQEEAVEKLVHIKPLEGKNVFLNIDLASAIHFTYLIERLGGNVNGISVPYVDLENRENLKKLHSLSKVTTWIVANGQPFEKANVLSKKPADFYISLDEQTAFAASQSAVPVSLKQTGILGYEGLKNFVKRLERSNNLLGSYPLRQEEKTPFYKASWLRKSSNWYVKQEVK
jgi:nitrogenase molybdenum-iron protein alpha chain